MKPTDIERHLRSVEIADNGLVKIKFLELIHLPGVDGGPSRVKKNKFTVESEDEPHDNFKNCMTKLRKLGLEEREITVNSKQIGEWGVCQVKIAGDVLMRQSRVKIVLTKITERTTKASKMETGQITMYGDSTFEKHEELAKQVEDLIAEVWQYLNGAYNAEDQLPLLPERTLALMESE